MSLVPVTVRGQCPPGMDTIPKSLIWWGSCGGFFLEEGL